MNPTQSGIEAAAEELCDAMLDGLFQGGRVTLEVRFREIIARHCVGRAGQDAILAVANRTHAEDRATIDRLHSAASDHSKVVQELCGLLQSMLNVAENCDETGYAEGVGFVDIDKLHASVTSALALHQPSGPAQKP